MNKAELLEYLKSRGFSEKIINAFDKVKREDFILKNMKEYAYENMPLLIGHDQTISQPHTIAFMLNLLNPKEGQKILEIGSGSGYVLALMSEITNHSEIYGIEIIKELVDKSKKALSKYENITVINANGFNGLPDKAPFDRILISASASEIPEHLYYQLNDLGIIVASVKDSIFQIKKEKGKITKKEFPGFAFVPLIEDKI